MEVQATNISNYTLKFSRNFMKENILSGDKGLLENARLEFNHLFFEKLKVDDQIIALKKHRIQLKQELSRIDNLINNIKTNNMAKNYTGAQWLAMMTENEQMNYRIAIKSLSVPNWGENLDKHYNSINDFILDSIPTECEIPYWVHVVNKYKYSSPASAIDNELHADDNEYRERYDNQE